MLKVLRPIFLGSLLFTWAASALAQEAMVREADYVGNVYGSVTDAETGMPIAGAEVTLVDKPLSRSRAEGVLTLSNKGDIVLPVRTVVSRWRILTNETGKFLFSGVATPFPSKPYTVIATAPGYDSAIVNYVPVLPGAVMALKVSFTLTKGENQATVFDATDENAPVQYGDRQRAPQIPQPDDRGTLQAHTESLAPAAEATSSLLALNVYATQEGHIGLTTSNQHVIRAGDNFVALPSRRALCSLNGHEFQVQIRYNNLVATAPVWDVGPLNIKDDYWDPVTMREMWADLPFGLPEAQAAFQTGYNGKRAWDGVAASVVPSPAGIDLASGTASTLGFKTLASQWVTVTYLWTTGHSDFSISAPPSSFAVAPGGSASIPITVSSIDGFSAFITPSVTGLPGGSTGVFSPAPFAPWPNGQVSTTLTVRTTGATPSGTYALKVSGTVGSVVKTSVVSLTVTPPPLSASSSCQPAVISLGGTVTCRVTAVGGLPPYRFSINGQPFSQPQASMQASASMRPSQSGAIVSVVKDSANQQALTSSQVQVYGPLTASCSASPNPVRANNTITWRAQAIGGSGSFSYRWLNSTTTPSYSKSYPTAQSVSNWVVITDTQLNQSQTGTCSLTVTR